MISPCIEIAAERHDERLSPVPSHFECATVADTTAWDIVLHGDSSRRTWIFHRCQRLLSVPQSLRAPLGISISIEIAGEVREYLTGTATFWVS